MIHVKDTYKSIHFCFTCVKILLDWPLLGRMGEIELGAAIKPKGV